MSDRLSQTESQASPEDLGSWVARLLSEDQMLDMGHHQRRVDANLGMGWLYYALARLVRPTRVVVIGSWRGFSPIIFAKALADNAERGSVTFIDPSFVDDHWAHPTGVMNWFHRFGVDNVEHHKMTTQQFVNSEAYRALGEVGIVFIDGHHTQEQAQFDFEAFADRVSTHGLIMLHDSAAVDESGIYGSDRPYLRTVKRFVDQLRQDSEFQVFDLPFDQGLTLVRRSDSGDPE